MKQRVRVEKVEGLERICRWGHSATRVNDSVLVFGGYGLDLKGGGPRRLGDSILIELSRKEDKSICAELRELRIAGPCARERHSATECSQGVVLLFGRTTPALPLSDGWIYKSETWKPLEASGTWPCPRWSHAAVAGEGGLIVSGGRRADGLVPADLFVLSQENVWTRMQDAAIPATFAHAALAKSSTDLIFFGGHTPFENTRKVHCKNMHIRWRQTNCYAHTVVNWDNDWLLLGGVEPSIGYGQSVSHNLELPFHLRLIAFDDNAHFKYQDIDKEATPPPLSILLHNKGLKVLPVHAATVSLDASSALIVGGGLPCFTFGPVFGDSCSVHRCDTSREMCKRKKIGRKTTTETVVVGKDEKH